MAKFEALTLYESGTLALAICKAYAAGVPPEKIEEVLGWTDSACDVVIWKLGLETRKANGFDEKAEDG